MSKWLGTIPAIHHEQHFGDRVVRCFKERPGGIEQLFSEAVKQWPNAEAIVDGPRRFTYRELDRMVESFAAGLQVQGQTAGDRIALLLGNSAEFVIALYAIARIGAISVPVNIREQASGLAYILNHCTASAIVYDDTLEERLPTSDDVPSLRVRIMSGDGGTGLSFASLLASENAVVRQPGEGEDIGMILYTSGTTGRPKGAMLPHMGLVMAVINCVAVMGFREGERSAVPVPMSHITGITGCMLPMLPIGGCILVFREFKALHFIELAVQERMTYVHMVPAMYILCLMQEAFARADLSSWRMGVYGGAPMAPATIEKFQERLPHLRLMNAYGSTETVGPQVICPPSDTMRKSDFVGIPIPTADILIMDDDGREVLCGQTGEIWIRSGSVSPGYWSDLEATAREFCAGFWKSGDLGLIDEEGFIKIFDRKKDMLNRGGYKIFSAEVEQVLMALDGVVEAAIVGKPCPVLGERVHAFITITSNGPDEMRLSDYCRQNLSAYKVPESFTISYDPLPRNANGKLLKRVLRELVLSA